MSIYKSTYYQVLGVQPNVNSLAIKQAYRSLVKSYHPDVRHTADEKLTAHQKMAHLNEAYEILRDKNKRAAYDSSLGLNGAGIHIATLFPIDTEQIRQQYLNQTFNPAHHKITRILSRYKTQLNKLSQDIYDDSLVGDLEKYSNQIESILIVASQGMSIHKAPPSLSAAELMLSFAIAQAVDGLEELRYFCCNYNYDHLITAGNLFQESNKLLRQAFSLCRSTSGCR